MLFSDHVALRLATGTNVKTSSSRKLSILWIVNKEVDISPSRSSRYAMAEFLRSFGHKVVIAARYRHRRYRVNDSIRTVYLPTVNIRGLRLVSFLFVLNVWLPWYLFRGRPNVVLVDRTALVWGIVPWLLLCKLLCMELRWVLGVRSPPVEKKGALGWLLEASYRGGLRLAGRLLDGWTTITPALRVEVSKYGRIPRSKIEIWSSGVDPEQFSPFGRRRPQDWKLDGQFVVAYHGLLSNDRALSEAIEALSNIRHQVTDLCLFFLGDGPDRQRLVKQVRNLGLESRVVFHEPVSNSQVPDYLALAAVGLVPAPDTPWYRSSSPLKLVEYLAMGKPVVVTDIQANREVLGKRGDAIWIKCGPEGRPSPEAIARGLLAARRQFTVGAISHKNREIAIARYSWTTLARRLELYLTNL